MTFRTALCYPPSAAVTVMPPLGIGYLAAVAERRGFPTDIYDLSRRHLTWPAFDNRLRAGAYRVVGVSVSTPNYAAARALVGRLRRVLPEALIVLGGAHPSAFTERTLREFGVDFAFQREAEVSFPAFLAAVAADVEPLGAVPGVFAVRDGRFVGEPEPSFIGDLDALPWPAWDKLEPQRYPPMPHQFFVRRLPVAPVLTSRGCPMDCSFCATSFLFGAAVRTRRADDVVEELRFLRDRFGIREVHFEDDNMTLPRDHARTLFEKIIAANLGLTYKFPNGLMTKTLDDEVLSLMARAGVYQISLGIETTVENALDKETKFVPYEQLRAVVAAAKRRNIEVQGLFVVGLPYDDANGVRRTVRDAIRLGLDLAHFGVFVPLPGSAHGAKLAGCDIATINFFTPFGDAHLPAKDLKQLQRRALLRFYLRWRPLWKLLSMFKLRQTRGVLDIVRKYLIGR